MASYIDNALATRQNNFDALRLIAALAVIVSHSNALFKTGFDPVHYVTRLDTAGGFAVGIFFFISGFLVTRSLLYKRDYTRFAIARVARVVPALFPLTLLTVFVMGPLVTTLPLSEYFEHKQTARYLAVPLIFPISFKLPGVFDGGAVNGSLWSLPLEAACYIILPLIFLIGVFKWRYGALAFAVGVFLFESFARQQLGLSWADKGPLLFLGVSTYALAKFGTFFAIGAAFYVHRNEIPRSGWVALGVLLLMIFGESVFRFGYYLFFLTLPYLVFWVAFTPLLRTEPFFAKVGDVSYGVYIYAYPIQQLLLHYFPSIDVWSHIFMSSALSIGCGYVSWKLVEKPALGVGRALANSRLLAPAK